MGARAGWSSLRHGLTGLVLLLLQSCLVSHALAQTPASDGPANYQGIYLNPTGAGTSETLSCDTSSIFALSGTFAGCCSIGGNCNFPTACTKGTPTNRRGGRWSCGQDRACYTMTVYDAYPRATESWLVHNCAKSWSASTIYRAVPRWMTSATTPPPSAGAGTAGSEPTAGTDDGGGPTATPGGPPAASTSDGGAEPLREGEPAPNKAWIAGAVIGGVVGAAGLGALGFWLGRRRRMAAAAGKKTGTGFKLHSATLLRSGGSGGGGGGGGGGNWPAYPSPGFKRHVGAVQVAEGVEIEGYTPEKGLPTSPQEMSDTAHAELPTVESDPVPKKQVYTTFNV
ncbi:hypothetical protein B0I37DRAFT_237039 [Chaetomium sp. MPI-CAGE-AT-0009]|nr:hypothetical protein B0I37DRAFT_237039 [Chaetomium sp. MPI-CAGE-AT-0009]